MYVDDDNVLAPDYLQTVHELLHVHPRLGAIGAGALEPDFAAEPVPQFQPYLPLLALRSHAQADWSHDPRDADCMPWGAGLCVKRPVALEYVQLVGQLDTHGLLDRRGQR